ncbi:MAG TPA: pyridoxal phosphate-dependent aminotransferase, partial [Bryobacterales bacterium]|nr:pyridoxal phosphate-dependent aminotransferase [Bryobacterales bacterium]
MADKLRFSQRLEWDRPSNRVARALEARRAAGKPLLDLTESNPTRAGFRYESDAVLEALAREESMLYEPQPAGLRRAREAVSAYYAQRGLAVEPDRILLTASTSEAYGYLFKLFADPGDPAVAPKPSYPLFEFLAALEGVRLLEYRLRYEDRWRVDFASLERALDAGARIALAVTPNNPTGSYLSADEMRRMAELCAARGAALVIDEVFHDYRIEAGPAPTAGGIEGPVFLLNGLSKILGLPQMKLAWIAALGPGQEEALRRLELIADTYLSVATPVQHALQEWLRLRPGFQAQVTARLRSNLARLQAAVGGSPCDALRVEGGWYAVLRLPQVRAEEDWALLFLEQDGVLVQPGYFFDFEEEAFA